MFVWLKRIAPRMIVIHQQYDSKTMVSRPVRLVRVVVLLYTLYNNVQFTTWMDRKPLFQNPKDSYE